MNRDDYACKWDEVNVGCEWSVEGGKMMIMISSG
jgi:hypothetical protein